MKSGFAAWWRLRSAREQRLLLAMAVLALVVGIWLLVIRPLGLALDAARERHGAAVIAAAEVKRNAALLRGAGRAGSPALAGAVGAIIAQSASEAGFPIDRLEPQGATRATIAIEAVRPQAFFAWLARMEAAGLVVERVSATPNRDQTLAVQAAFRARAS